jgi:hypothetical protein
MAGHGLCNQEQGLITTSGKVVGIISATSFEY